MDRKAANGTGKNGWRPNGSCAVLPEPCRCSVKLAGIIKFDSPRVRKAHSDGDASAGSIRHHLAAPATDDAVGTDAAARVRMGRHDGDRACHHRAWRVFGALQSARVIA